MTNEEREKMVQEHYQNFLKETAKSLGMAPEEVAKMDGFQSPQQVNNFIDFLVSHYGVSPEKMPSKEVHSTAYSQAVEILKKMDMQ